MRLFIRIFLKKGDSSTNLLLVYLLYNEPTFKDGGVGGLRDVIDLKGLGP